jgi:3-methyl-2-oxobutanoate hydroxymethyltransferase
MMQKITIKNLKEMKESGEKIACLTSYDASFAKIQDEAGIDLLLVGDSLGMVLQGGDNTLKVSISDMIYHSKLVSNVAKRAVIVTDMPFMSYSTPPQALGNAARLISEGGAHVVKIEGGSELSEVVNLLSQHGIPVCGHLGLTPQSIHKIGGLGVQAATDKTAKELEKDAISLQEAGASCLVLECIPSLVAERVTKLLEIPVIGIGAGSKCDGQVLVLYDILGLTSKQPKFSKNFLSGEDSISGAIKKYVKQVKNNSFPTESNSYE